MKHPERSPAQSPKGARLVMLLEAEQVQQVLTEAGDAYRIELQRSLRDHAVWRQQAGLSVVCALKVLSFLLAVAAAAHGVGVPSGLALMLAGACVPPAALCMAHRFSLRSLFHERACAAGDAVFHKRFHDLERLKQLEADLTSAADARRS